MQIHYSFDGFRIARSRRGPSTSGQHAVDGVSKQYGTSGSYPSAKLQPYRSPLATELARSGCLFVRAVRAGQDVHPVIRRGPRP